MVAKALRTLGLIWSQVHATQGVTDPFRPCVPSCVPQGPDVALPEIVTFCGGDTAAMAVIGPLTKTDPGPKQVQDCVEVSVGSLRCVDVEP